MQENIDLLANIDADIYAISVDTPENSKALKEAGNFSFTFLSDPSLEIIEYVKMDHEQMSLRGFSILDPNGVYVYNQVNDLWGEQIEATANIIIEKFENESALQ